MLNTRRQFLIRNGILYILGDRYIAPQQLAVIARATIVYSTNIVMEEDCNTVLVGIVFG